MTANYRLIGWVCALVTIATVGIGAVFVIAFKDSEHASLIDRLEQEEGFRAKPYTDTRGVLTIGYGTDISEGITEAEGAFLMRTRLDRVSACIREHWPAYSGLTEPVGDAILDMGYQLGCEGVLGFHHMLQALEDRDYEAARAEALDSAWARETPARAHRVISAFPEGS